MALIRCPECGREISQYADKCPGCGWPVPKPTAREGNYSESSNYEDIYEEYLRQRRQAQRDSAANGAADNEGRRGGSQRRGGDSSEQTGSQRRSNEQRRNDDQPRERTKKKSRRSGVDVYKRQSPIRSSTSTAVRSW